MDLLLTKRHSWQDMTYSDSVYYKLSFEPVTHHTWMKDYASWWWTLTLPYLRLMQHDKVSHSNYYGSCINMTWLLKKRKDKKKKSNKVNWYNSTKAKWPLESKVGLKILNVYVQPFMKTGITFVVTEGLLDNGRCFHALSCDLTRLNLCS